ncbi:ABC transporter permease [uncultured Pseudokineococcus sp.]|uniref:ABC transporter permease n=1 Tax=uncultured Pseudokineococcus sp. TaxID=1642928 RepID=UPI00260E30C6|nr:ABC transporter permease [uncultured Pseudokineococcus sp.]
MSDPSQQPSRQPSPRHEGASPGARHASGGTDELEHALGSAPTGAEPGGGADAAGARPGGRRRGPASAGGAQGYAPRRTLTLRAEAARQVTRRRTVVTAVLLALLPVLLVGAFALGDGDTSGAPDFVQLATEGGANLALFTLFVATGFLIPLVVALLCGDPLSSEASWSSLRYLLVSPVPRRRLLRSKLVVALVSSVIAVAELMVVAYLLGTLVYGADPLVSPGGDAFDLGEGLWRLGVATAYVLVSTAAFGGFAFLVGTRSDAPLAAVGSAVLLVVISTVLDQIQALGDLREALPTHFQYAWVGLFQPDPAWDDLLTGSLWALLWAVVAIRLAFWSFGRKDVLS